MPLNIESQSNTFNADELLDKYLTGALNFIGKNATKGSAKAAAKGFARIKDSEAAEYYGRPDVKGLSVSDIERREKKVKTEAQAHSFKEKMDYALNGAAHRKSIQTDLPPADIVTFVASMVVATPFIGAVNGGLDAPSSPAGLGAIAVGVGMSAGIVAARRGVYKMTEPKNDAQKMSNEEYAKLKHTQLALKALKREIERPKYEAEKQIALEAFAQGMTNPGGVISALKFSNKGR